MLTGMLRVLDARDLDRLHEAALNVLENTGLRLRGRFLLEALADAGCKVDFEAERAWLRPDLVERQVAAQRDRYRMVRSSLWHPFCREMPADDVAIPDEFACDYGFGAPQLYDWRSGEYRAPTVQDQIDMVKLGNGLECVRAICAPFICGDVDPRMEIIESARVLLLHTRKPGWVGTSCAAEVKYLAEFAKLATNNDETLLRTQPPIFVNAYCTTSPLKIDTRSCEVLEQALKYKFPVNFAAMPILGGTTPITPAGSVVVSAAELLGGLTAGTLIDPDVFYYCTSVAGEMDMRTTQVCFATPGAILTDAALHQLFRRRYGLVLNVDAAYVEAKTPGIQAALLKTYRQMAFGSTVSHALPLGLLDNGSVFCPAQAMIDLDMSKAIYGFACGMEVSDETLCVDLIKELEFCENGTYLESEHTYRHFRELQWDTEVLDRTYRDEGALSCAQTDEEILRKADQAWRDIVAGQETLAVTPAFAAEVDRIVADAGKELLASG